MILIPLIALIPLFAQTDKPATNSQIKPPTQNAKEVMLNRAYKVGDKLEYQVDAGLHVETRELGLNTWIPQELDTVYRFTAEVVSLKPDGGAVVHYLRPTVTDIYGETVDSGPKTKVNKLNWDMLLTMSPINEILSVKDQTKRKPNENGGGSENRSGDKTSDLRFTTLRQDPLKALLDEVTGGIVELVMFMGTLDSGLDFAPKLPWVAVTPGYTWKKSGGFSPQKLKESGKMAVQRLDYTYTYTGPIDVDGKHYLRIHADLALDTDIGAFIMQEMDWKPADTELKTIPFTLKAQMDFDLDPATKRTVRAIATCGAEAHIFIKEYDNAYDEVKLNGKTTMKLLSAKP